MKAFYLIHMAIILEVILAILGTLKLYDYVLKIRKLNKKIIRKTDEKVEKLQFYREKIIKFNKSCEQKLNYAHTFDMVTKLVMDLSVQGLLKRFVFPKNNFFAKMLSYKTTIFWFLASFFVFNKKKA